jgi:hypothetical protein
MVAALSWWRARYKNDPEYIRALHFYDAVLKWHENLPLDNEEVCATVDETYIDPRYGRPDGAQEYAASLPAVPVPPEGVRRRWIRES